MFVNVALVKGETITDVPLTTEEEQEVCDFLRNNILALQHLSAKMTYKDCLSVACRYVLEHKYPILAIQYSVRNLVDAEDWLENNALIT